MTTLAKEILDVLGFFGPMEIPTILKKMRVMTTEDLVTKALVWLVAHRKVRVTNGLYAKESE